MTMRRKRARFIAPSLLLSAATMLFLTGCNNNGSGDTGTGTATTPGTTATQKGGDPLQDTAAKPTGEKLVIAWAEWEPAKQMEKLAADFTKETNIPVEVQQIPWSDFENKVKLAWSGQDPAYDIIIGDSQWLGKAATSGHYVELTDWVKTNIPVADIAPAALKSYGEYPAGSNKLYAVPCMSDALVFAYRKDLFDDAANKTAFQAKYKKPLAIPKTWDDFKNVAEFFTQKDKNLYGAALFYSKEYDGVTMGFDPILWSYGGKLSDGKKAEGVINSPDAVKALDYYVSLKPFTPPGSETYYFSECLRDFQEGKVAMAESWFAFLPDLVNKEKNKFADKTGYFPVPAGPKGQFVSLGGQGMSISKYSKQEDNAKKFVAWFSKEENQMKWAKLGGLTANNKVAATEDFKKANPFNPVFTASVPYLKDFYNNPEYSELLTPAQNELNAAVAGAKTPKAALDAIAKAQQPVLDAAGQ